MTALARRQLLMLVVLAAGAVVVFAAKNGQMDEASEGATPRKASG